MTRIADVERDLLIVVAGLTARAVFYLSRWRGVCLAWAPRRMEYAPAPERRQAWT